VYIFVVFIIAVSSLRFFSRRVFTSTFHRQNSIAEVSTIYLTFIYINRTLTTFKLDGEVTSLSESSQGEVGDNREKWGDFWEKLIAINRNIVLRPL